MLDINDKFKQLAEYKRIQEDTAAVITALEDEIKAYMLTSGKDTIIGNEHKATYKSVISNRIDTKALKNEMPQIAAQYTKAVESKRFIFK